MKKTILLLLLAGLTLATACRAQQQRQPAKSLHQLQQEFVDLRFGMFIHFNIPTFMKEDWADPEAPAALFNPTRLDCAQWAAAAASANMSYGCLTTKHHSGFCIWDTKTTGYNVMNSPLRRDVVREYVDAFRARGLKVMLYFSILDTHHRLRPGWISREHVEMVKAQLRELLTNYGEVTALVIDGWDAPWSRISYDAIPFEEIYLLVKSLQPNCLVMDLNAAKYPSDVLYYTDIKSYEQGAGQHISKERNRLPALSCLPVNQNWFWKTRFPDRPTKDPVKMVEENIIPMNNAYCNFILNVAPNREGLIDDNALATLAAIGKRWKNDGPTAVLPPNHAPIISSNLAKNRPADASWSWDMSIMDFAVDDDFSTAWTSIDVVENPWFEVYLDGERAFNAVVIVENEKPRVKRYRLEYRENGDWKPLFTGENNDRVKIHRFDRVYGDRVRLLVESRSDVPSISEFQVYNERTR
ncbi:MAG: alpha-L-fucosidase [Odoribacteraceae bacterium]|jgi:alpha-L-fucosidase|nr:alpha-L-fucosidase [Odoribacteraceae bacterium]